MSDLMLNFAVSSDTLCVVNPLIIRCCAEFPKNPRGDATNSPKFADPATFILKNPQSAGLKNR